MRGRCMTYFFFFDANLVLRKKSFKTKERLNRKCCRNTVWMGVRVDLWATHIGGGNISRNRWTFQLSIFGNLHFPLMICNGIQQKQENCKSLGILSINQRGSGGGFTDNLTKWQNPSEKIHNTTYPLLLFFQIFSWFLKGSFVRNKFIVNLSV